MAINTNPIKTLGKFFDSSQISRLANSLPYNPLVWDTLDSETFVYQLHQQLGDKVENWNPGNIALVQLEIDFPEHARILSQGAKDIQPSLTKLPIEKLDQLIESNFDCLELIDAALAICGLLVRSDEHGSWEWLEQKGVPKIPHEMLSILLPHIDYSTRTIKSISSSAIKSKGIVKSILASPLPEANLAEIFNHYLQGSSTETASSFISELQIFSPKVSSIVSKSLLSDLSFSDDEYLRVRDLKFAAKIASAADQHKESISLLQEARTLQEGIEADLLLNIGKEKIELGENQQASELFEKALSKSSSHRNLKNIIKSAGAIGKNLPIKEFAATEKSEVTLDEMLMLLEYARLNNQSIAVSKELNSIILHPDFRKLDNSTKRDVASTMVNYDKVEAANSLLRALLSDNPNDLELLSASARAQAKGRDIKAAIQTSEFIRALEPDHTENTRMIGELYLDSGEKEKAYDVFSTLVDSSVEPTISDRLGLAKSALGVDKPNQAADICHDLVENGTSEVEVLRIYGDAFMLLNNPEQAIRLYQDAYNLDKTNEKTILAISNYYQTKGLDSVAKDFIQNSIVESGLEPLAVSMELLKLLETTGAEAGNQAKLNEIYNRLERGIQSFWLPDRPPVYKKLAKAFLENGDTAKAIEMLKKSHEISSDDATSIELAGILNAKKQYQKAFEIINPVILKGNRKLEAVFEYAKSSLGTSENLRKSSKLLESLNETLDQDTGQASILLAKTSFALEEFNKTSRLIDGLLESTPEESIQVEASRLKAKLLANDGHLDDAIQLIKQTSLNTTSDPTPLNQDLVELFYEAGLVKDALKEAKEIYQDHLDDNEIIHWYAELMELLQSPDEKLKALKQSIILFPKNIDNWIALGSAYAASGKTRDANEAFETAIKLPDVNAEHLFTAGATMAGFGCYKHALPFLVSSKEKASSPNPGLIAILAKTFAENDLESKAVDLLEKEIDAHPEDINNWLMLSDLYINMKAHESALDSLKRSKQYHEDNYLIELKRSNAYRAIGDFESALDYVEKALVINPLSTLAKYLGSKYAYYSKDLFKAENYLDSVNLSKIEDTLAEELPIRDILVLMSQIKRDSGDIPAAKALISSMEFTNLEPDPKSSALLSQLHTWHSEDADASQWLQKAIQQVELLKTSKDNISYGEGLIEIARAYSLKKDYAKALSAVKQAAKAIPNEIAGYQELAHVLIEQANYYHLLQEAGVINNKPHSSVVSSKTFSILNKSLNNAYRYNVSGANKTSLDQLKAAAKAAFHQKLSVEDWNTIPEFDDLSSTALINYFNQQNNWKDAVSVSEKSTENAATLLAEAKSIAKSAPELAAEIIHKAVEISGNNPVAQAIAAKRFLAEKDYDNAINHISSALQAMDNEPHWHTIAGECFAYINNIQPALYHYNNANELMPGNPEILHKMAKLYIRDNSPTSAIESLEKALKLRKKSADLWLTMAQAQMDANEPKKAVKSAEKALQIKPRDHNILLELAGFCLKARQPQKTLKHTKALKELKASLDDYLLLEAKAHAKLKDLDKAIAAVELGIEVAKDTLPFELQKAAFNKTLLSAEEYLIQMETLANNHPESPVVQNSLSQALFENGKTDEAVFAAQKALKLDAEDEKSLNTADIHASLGNMLRETGQQDQAIYHLSKAIEIEPKSVSNYQNISRVLVERKEFSKAIDYLENAISNDPNNSEHYVEMANVYKECKDYPNAEKMLKKASEISPEDLHIQRQLAGVLALNIIYSN